MPRNLFRWWSGQGEFQRVCNITYANFFLASCEVTLARTAGCLRETQRDNEARRAGEERGEGIAK